MLDLDEIPSEDALRRALERIDETQGNAWMRPALMHSMRKALVKPWVLDTNTAIKPPYGHQEGAGLGYRAGKQHGS